MNHRARFRWSLPWQRAPAERGMQPLPSPCVRDRDSYAVSLGETEKQKGLSSRALTLLSLPGTINWLASAVYLPLNVQCKGKAGATKGDAPAGGIEHVCGGL